ncbi:MAG: PHB depolymerase family esterase [Caldimonas sp.]
MKNRFLRKMMAATGLTSHGKLAEATATIQRALAASLATPTVPRPAAAPSPAARTASRTAFGDLGGDSASTATTATPERTKASGRFASSSFTNASGTRAFKLFEPSERPDGPRPLVVMLHGCTQSPDDFAAGTRMNELAQAQGVYVLYPEQAARSNVNRCWNWFVPADQKRGAGEPALIAGMTRHVMQTHAIDADRVFVAGLSAGGAMAAILAREYPDLFAAAGVHSGLRAGAAHDVASAFGAMKSGPSSAGRAHPSAPMIVFHGSADSTVAPANGDAVVAAALGTAPAAVAAEERGRTGPGRSWRRTQWHAEAGDRISSAEHWVVEGSPHAWSGGSSTGSYTDPSGPDASAEMLRFFLEHPRPQHG